MVYFSFLRDKEYKLVIGHIREDLKEHGVAYVEWEKELKSFLEKTGINIKSISSNLADPIVISFLSGKFNFGDIDYQDSFLQALTTELNYSETVAKFQKLYSENVSVIYESGREASLQVWNDDGEINSGRSETVDKLLQMSLHLIKMKKYPFAYPPSVYDFYRFKNGDFRVEAGMNKSVDGVENYVKETLNLVWDEAQEFVKALTFLNTHLEKVRISIFPKQKKLYFSLSLYPNNFIRSESGITATFLGVSREFRVFENSVIVERR